MIQHARSRYRRVEARTASGFRYAYWTRDMPQIPEHFIGSVVFLYPDRDAAVAGERYGGSGFLAAAGPSYSDSGLRYIVTNQHVAAKAAVARLARVDGRTELIETPDGGWHHHPDGDDVSVFPLDLGPQPWTEFLAASGNTFVSSADEVAPGDDVFFLGRFVDPNTDKQLENPTARFGHLAMAGTARVRTERGVAQESFVVEALSLPGYSGSAVVVYRVGYEVPPEPTDWLRARTPRTFGMDIPRPQRVRSSQRHLLLGVDWGHFHEKALVRLPDENPVPDKLYVRQNRGMAGVVPAWKITELLESEDVQAMREARREKLEQESAGVTLDLAHEVGESDEYERFKDLTQKVVSVPKKEVDEKRGKK